MTTEERLDRLERAVADLTLYTMTLCQNMQADVQTVDGAREFQKAKRSVFEFLETIRKDLKEVKPARPAFVPTIGRYGGD